MKKILFILVVSLISGYSYAQVYKVVGKDGSVTFTDVPVEGSEKMDLGRINSAERLAKPQPKIALPPAELREPSSKEYRVSIQSPAPEATIRNNLGEVSISAQSIPALKGKLRLTLDGQVIGANRFGEFKLKNINRGSHTFHIDLIDNTGKILASSSTQTFYMHKASALINSKP